MIFIYLCIRELLIIGIWTPVLFNRLKLGVKYGFN